MPLLKEESLAAFLREDLSHYAFRASFQERELLAPSTWHMPEVFRKTLTAHSEHYFNEVHEQNRWTGMVAYNFSNGLKLTARDILRHPFHRLVPRDLLPQPRKEENALLGRWPLTQRKEALFLSQNLREVGDIMQSLLARIVTEHRQGKIPLFIQTRLDPDRGFAVNGVEFDPTTELDWRVEFTEKHELLAEFKLVSNLKKSYHFFESFAICEDGSVLVHPWLTELRGLEESLAVLEDRAEMFFSPESMPLIEVRGELEGKTVLKHLRHRSIPVQITGGSRTLGSDRSVSDIYLDEKGYFFIQHRARVEGQKDVISRGWTPRTVLYLQALSEGLPFLLNSEAKDMAARSRRSREWDMKLLKHLGVLQYLLLETLSFYFEGELSDGRIVEEKEIFPLLHDNIHALLISGSGVVLAKEMTLTELISRPVLSCFEDFVSRTLKLLKAPEAFYSEAGEVILEGVVEREFRLLFELLKKLALRTRGEVFRKSRTSFLSRICAGDAEKDVTLKDCQFHFPRAPEEEPRVHETLEALQDLLRHGFQLFYHGQALQELADDDFLVDFNLQADGHGKDFNWFELHPRFFLHGVELDPHEMTSLGKGGVIEHDGKIYLVPKKQMPSLRRLEHFWERLQKGKTEKGAKKFGGDKIYQLPRHQILELLALRASGYGIRGDEEWKRLCAFYDGLGTAATHVEIPSSVKAELKPYQLTGVKWLRDLYNLRMGALLADDMGLGKTLQTLTFLEDLRVQGELGQVLIVVPSSLIYNWQSEVEKFTPQIPLEVFSSKDMDRIGRRLELKEDLVVMTTYGLLMEQENFFAQYKYRVVIFDEAQNLKNITTKRTSSARSLNAQFKVCLTGTPMENHYGEFYSIVDLLVPGSLGRIEDFRRQFVNTDLVSREQMDDLKLKIKPLLLRRTKKEILDQLPEKQETKVSIAFEAQQREIYRDIALAYNQSVQESFLAKGEASVQLQMLTALLRLRQACSDPGALPNVRYEKVPPKLEALLDSVQEIVESGESALVFTQFIQTLEHTAKLLAQAGIPVFVLHGGVPTKQRQKILAEFNKLPGGAVLVMTLKTGGVGLNLTKASYVFHLEPWWNPSVENQATDRAHRLGQSKAVQVFRYIMHESLEEKIELLKNRKDKKFAALFAETEKTSDLGPQGSAALSKEDFDMLLGLK